MGKIVRVLVKSSGKIQGIEEKAAKRMATAAPQEYQILETPKIEVTAIPEKKSDAGLVASTVELNRSKEQIESVQKELGKISELNAGNAIPTNKQVSEPVKYQTTEDVLQGKKMGRPAKQK